MACSCPGSSVYGILQPRVLEWDACSSSGDLPDPGIKPASLESPVLAGRFLTTPPPRKPQKESLIYFNTTRGVAD